MMPFITPQKMEKDALPITKRCAVFPLKKVSSSSTVCDIMFLRIGSCVFVNLVW